MKRIGCALVLACLLLAPTRPAAGEWTADIVDMESSPPRFVAVDKKAQSFSLLSRQSPLRVLAEIPCATGQELGDKFKEGDLKTPEGVYFITTRKSSGLNYQLYGDLAFPLDFPNPADVLRHKSGHGIWIHGRGHAIIPYETQGCVALSTPDIHRMDPDLAEGMPVVIADEIHLGGKDAAELREEAKEVVAATHAWAKAWQDRSEAFFDFHDPEKFSITEGQPFSAFRSHKERLFKALPWIKVDLSDVRAIAGPDYWVTYFVQLYRSPTLVSQGIKRLYWQRGADGRFRIIGMEYEEMPVTLAEGGRAKSGKLASPGEVETDTRRPDDAQSEEDVQVRQLVDAHEAAMDKMAQKAFANLTLRPQPTAEDEAILEVAKTGAVRPGVSPFATDAMRQAPPAPPAIAQASPPAAVAAAQPAAAVASPAKATPTLAPAPVQTPAPAAPPVVVAAAEPAPAPVPSVKTEAAPAQPAPAPAPTPTPPPAPAKPASVTAEQAAQIASLVEGWRSAWEHGRLPEYLAFYADDARQGNLRGKEAIRRQKQGVWRGREPGRVGMSVVSATPVSGGFDVVCAEDYQGKGGRDSKGYKRLTVVPSGGRLLIAEERWSKNRPESAPAAALPAVAAAATAPAPVSPPAPAKPAAPAEPAAPAAPAKVDRTAAVAAMVEAWRSAWEHGRLPEYAAFYAENAVQGTQRGREAIRDQKAALWKDKAPKRVTLSDVKIRPRKNGFVVTCLQEYASRDGGLDRGLKTLYLAPSGDGFAIVEEKWSRL